MTTSIASLDSATPGEGSFLYLGDNELRTLKAVIKDQFPTLTAAVTVSPAEWNALDGLEPDWATQLAAKADTTHNHDGEAIGIVTLGDGSLATTQATGDDGTKVATTAFTKLGIAAAGLSSVWDEVVVVNAASATTLSFTATSVYDHYRMVSVGLQAHGSQNLEMLFGTRDTWFGSGDYGWAVNYTPGTGSASSDSLHSSIELDAARGIQAGPLALDMHVYTVSTTRRMATWKMAGQSGSVPTAFLGGGVCYQGTANRWRIGFPSGGGASLSGRIAMLGRRK
jgi:hypothetical protein